VCSLTRCFCRCVKLTNSSGHGGQTKDLDGDEDDGYDEVIYPLDFKQAGHIVDDERACNPPRTRSFRVHADFAVHDRMVKPLPPGCRLTAIFDSCVSVDRTLTTQR
jgi:hypothetical protein